MARLAVNYNDQIQGFASFVQILKILKFRIIFDFTYCFFVFVKLTTNKSHVPERKANDTYLAYKWMGTSICFPDSKLT